MRESRSVLCAHAPWHRVERAADPDGLHMQVLTALKPEQGWPRLWAWVPVRWRGGARFERLAAPLHAERFHAEPGSSPGEPLRHALALRHFPAGPGAGLLCLFIYLDPRADAEEGGNGAALADLRAEDLELAIDELLLRQPALPEWGHAFVPSPSAEPEDADGELSFLLAACQYPPGMLDVSRGAERDPTLASPADAAMARLVAFCRQHPDGASASLLLIAGDEIYADASGGLADPSTSAERYARPYQHFKAGLARYLPPTLARIVHAPDDHEVQDNCEPCLLPDGSHDPGAYTASARAAAWQYRWEPDGQRPQGSAQRFWHSFDWRGAAFFVMDSRLEREPRTVARVAEAQMIGAAQRQAFSAWLQASAGRPRFVLSGALLLPRRRSSAAHVSGSLRSDAWCGFPASQQWLLAELWRQRASGVVFLSGDEHRSGHVSAELRRADGSGPALRLHSIHSSALYAPWPFAITDPEEFAAPERFGIDAATGTAPQQAPSELLSCEVGEWQDHPGDGFAWLRLIDGGARLELRYDKAGAGALYAALPMREPDALLPLG